MLWGSSINSVKPFKIPNNHKSENMKISNICLSPKSPGQGKTSLYLKMGMETPQKKLYIVTLETYKNEHCILDVCLNTHQNVTLFVEGNGEMHISGYYEIQDGKQSTETFLTQNQQTNSPIKINEINFKSTRLQKKFVESKANFAQKLKTYDKNSYRERLSKASPKKTKQVKLVEFETPRNHLRESDEDFSVNEELLRHDASNIEIESTSNNEQEDSEESDNMTNSDGEVYQSEGGEISVLEEDEKHFVDDMTQEEA